MWVRLALLGGLTGCSFSDDGVNWRDQLAADGPCWRVDLADGLDEGSTSEVHDLFACVNQGDGLAPLSGMDQALDQPDRTGKASGLTLAELVNNLPEVGVDPFALLGTASDLLDRRAELLQPMLELVVELTYGLPYEAVLTQVRLTDPDALSQGVIAPFLPVLGLAAGAALDDDLAALGRLTGLLQDEVVPDLLCTLLAFTNESDPALVTLRSSFARDLGQALELARSPGNDRWPDATGDSLRDLVVVLMVPDWSGQTALERLAPTIAPILTDATLRGRLVDVVVEAEAGGHLDPLPVQLAHLVEVDVEGGERTPGEDSALTALLRLLDAGNEEVVCTIDLGITELDIALGNLSVSLLRLMATLDPNTVESGVDILGTVLGWNFSQSTLEWVAGTGVCPTLDEQLVGDLQSLDRLGDPEVGDLLAVLLEVLGAFYDKDDADDRTLEIVNLLSGAWQAGLTPPLEEVLVDLGDSALMDDLTDMLPLMLEAESWDADTCPDGSAPLSVDATLELASEALTDGDPFFSSLEPVTTPILEHEATWQALGAVGSLLQQDGTRLGKLGHIATELVALDPELEALDTLVELLEAEDALRLGLRLVETPALLDALGQTSDEQEGPLPFAARLISSGTVEVLLRTVDLVLGELEGMDTAKRVAQTRRRG